MESIVLYVTRGSVVLADVIVLITTWSYAPRRWRGAMRVDTPATLDACLFRDGTVNHSVSRKTMQSDYLCQVQYISCTYLILIYARN